MAAEAIIFIPSAAMFRQTWLQKRAEAAGLLTLAIEGVPGYEGGEMLSKKFMHDTDVSLVVQKRIGPNGESMSQLVLGAPPDTDKIIIADLRTKRRLPLFRESFRDFFSKGDAYIRVLSEPSVQGVESLELLVPQKALKMALTDYSRRVLLWSLAISILTGLMIYAALSRMIVRPISKLARGLARFRQDPRKHLADDKPILRQDEIGQLENEFIDMKDGVRLAFQRQERLATLGMAMAKINHDLRNVLSSTQLISDRLLMAKEDSIKGMGERLERVVGRGVNLCEATLKFSQSVEELPKPRSIRIALLIEEAATDSMAEAGKVKFVNDVDSNLKIMADPDQTYRIFHNLFRNAVQALLASNVEAKNILKVKASIKDDKVRVQVIDTGTGLPKKAQENLFKAFTSSARSGGTGLGLTIARELARAQGGNLILDKTGPEGTIFIVGLPLLIDEKTK